MRSVNVSSLDCNLIYEGRTTDYDGQKVSTEHTIEHLDDPTLFGEDYETSGHGDECWEYCHPDTRNSDSMDCNHCPSSDEPDRWREFADLGIEHVQCSTDLATLPYDLSNLIKVG